MYKYKKGDIRKITGFFSLLLGSRKDKNPFYKMAKKKGNKNADAQRNTRDIQTPFSDREDLSKSNSEKVKSKNTNELDGT